MDTRPSRRIRVAVGAPPIIGTMLSGPAFGQATTTPGTGTPAATGSPAATTTALAATSPTAVPPTPPVVGTATPTAQPAATTTSTPAPAPAIAHDERYFTQTG